VTICASCGKENPEGFQFCGFCTAPLADAPAREQRKTVTALFCDVTGSTALGESTDPEALRALLARYFERMKGIVESHGGTVEKFIGDAVMAVFGVPLVHEDDALRACRAAVEMRDALPELGVQARIGLNTGEVVTGTQERLATGDAVNVAARLEQAAQPGEILLGADTHALVRGASETEPVEPLVLKGKTEPVSAFRLVAVTGGPVRRHKARFVGRIPERQLLDEAWRRSIQEGRCEHVTVIGDPGVGKSRLAAEFLAASDARPVYGRCVSYGEGITYWPVVEVLKQIATLPSDPTTAAPLRSLLGENTETTSSDEIAWAFRKLLEEHAPLVCVFDDIQWGEETFLDLVEHVALLSTGAPILLLCLARPELAERRPQWPVTLRLDPLPHTDVDALIPETFSRELRERIERAAGGNPLFVTEMVAIADEAGEDVAVPPNLSALLAARLDRLEQPERSVLERGAIEGELFHRTAVQALSGDRQVAPRLAALVRKELVRPDIPQLPGDDAFRFRHLLIRDAAYDALPKMVRAELHERFASWLEQHGEDLIELDDVVGHHLEQAAQYKAELGHSDSQLSQRAGARLASAGRRALSRGDIQAAQRLLDRALALIRPVRFDVHLELDLAEAQTSTETAAEVADAVVKRAQQEGDEVGEAVARVVAADYRVASSVEPPIEEWESAAQAALPLLQRADDHAGLARVWFALGGVANLHGQYEEWAQAREQARRYSRLAGRGDPWLGVGGPLLLGPRPADQALRTIEARLSDAPHPLLVLCRAELLAMLGHFSEAWPAAEEASAQLAELGQIDGSDHLAVISGLAGNYKAAEHYLGLYCMGLEDRGDRGHLSSYAPERGRVLCILGRHDEAEPLAKLGRELGDRRDAATQLLWRGVQALVDSRRGDHSEALRLAREAVEIAEQTDGLNYQGDRYCDLGEVLAAAGRNEEAAEALQQALQRYERKKNLAMIAQVKPRLDALHENTPT
jgi:class 3 adenylate cyclase/tetratricopeptide (TPR) repeat protein